MSGNYIKLLVRRQFSKPAEWTVTVFQNSESLSGKRWNILHIGEKNKSSSLFLTEVSKLWSVWTPCFKFLVRLVELVELIKSFNEHFWRISRSGQNDCVTVKFYNNHKICYFVPWKWSAFDPLGFNLAQGITVFPPVPINPDDCQSVGCYQPVVTYQLGQNSPVAMTLNTLK